MGGELSGVTGEDEECDLHVKDLIGPRKVLVLNRANAIAQPILSSEYGLFLEIAAPTGRDLSILGAVIGAGLIAGILPALKACRQSLADGMIVRT